ncbi:5-carboxymethyl-2-hydroxymuconate Delta-isomerase [Cellulophaga lytica]|uniref:4-oxalocrotonate tautomerase n=1 Tax=Cellulophaga lytica (strain ATCC 23178 / DSM 7489 / JCM 8516 / NBRC 14961 / NCIMB 1423 / VKM B-1433 / Cy l20) TaxID=867900 RepID=F0R9P4_CELLC|nr:5-carboxymethyl-2-hydroxymuconate Delta-isomerase [Cellulophaga lytica]ADY29376.1 4-oxalocrotonate tautomerase [Cellulophaga lytica DSM 7489]WQG76449.1 5-carboxymethyl-2-hydroxymuconate Delta-isomerase [Cellulophaga lytica]
MPHFVIDCSSDILKLQNPAEVLQSIHAVAVASNLFDEADIKVRLNPFAEHYLVGGEQKPFIHVFANIMEGRTKEQKANLSKEITRKLSQLFPEIPFIAINIRDFEKETYYNKSMI